MLKRLRKRLRQRRLAAAMALALAIATPAAPAYADTDYRWFDDKQAHTVSDNIVTNAIALEVAFPGTSATMSGGSITLTGAPVGKFAVYAQLGGTVDLTNVAVSNVDGSAITGLVSLSPGSRITVTGGSITIRGDNGIGAYGIDQGVINLNDVTLRVGGTGGYGVYAHLDSRITMAGGSIAMAGDGSHGAYAYDNGTAALYNVAVATSGANSYGAYTEPGMSGAGTVTMTGGSITTTGTASHGAYINNAGAINLTDVTINAAGTDSYALSTVGGGTITASVNGQDVSGGGGLLAAAGGTINLTASGNSRLTGVTAAVNGGTANLTLNGNAAWTSPGNASLTTLTLNGGTVTIAAAATPRPYKLDITGNLAGTGGTFNITTNVSDTSLSDLIQVRGSASGAHRLAVRTSGGTPADPRQAFLLVDVNEAAANTASFTGGSDLGAYRYGVGKGAVLAAGYSGIAGLADFYLYNTFRPSTPANAAVGTNAAASAVWYGEMNEIRKRLGDLRAGPGGDGLWARTYANEYKLKPGDGQDFDQRLYGLELGEDTARKYAGGRRHTGWVAGAGWADRTFDLGGSGKTDSLYLGGYTSWLKDDGAYWDIVVKHNWFRHRFDTPLLGGGGDNAAYNSTGLGLSVETGQRFARANGVFWEPQAELAALWTKGNRYTTANGLAVDARAETSLQLRVGAVVGRITTTPAGSRQVYGKLAWVQELAGDNRTSVDGVSFASSLKGGRLVAGAGLTVDTARSQLYLDVETAWGKKTDKPWGINLGCRWKL